MIFGFGWEPLGNSFLSSFYDFKCKKICVQSSRLLLKHSVAHSFWRKADRTNKFDDEKGVSPCFPWKVKSNFSLFFATSCFHIAHAKSSSFLYYYSVTLFVASHINKFLPYYTQRQNSNMFLLKRTRANVDFVHFSQLYVCRTQYIANRKQHFIRLLTLPHREWALNTHTYENKQKKRRDHAMNKW